MRWLFGLLFLIPFLFSGCGIRERETSVEKKETELAQKEQELDAKEKELQLKEAELIKRTQWLDSTEQDTAAMFNPQLLGQWNARMTCTETTCSGSAVGDTKTEAWELTYQNEHIIARAMSGENMVRVYTGTYKNNLLELTENVELSPSTPATKILVRLSPVNETTLEGQIEIIRTGDCKITYALQLTK